MTTTTAIIKVKTNRPDLLRGLKDEIMYSNFISEYDEQKNVIKVYYDRDNEKATKRLSSIIWFYDLVIDEINYYTESGIKSDMTNQKRLDEWC